MKRLTAFSILDCDDIKEEVHHRQIDDIFNKIYSLDIDECGYEIKSVDEYHSENSKSKNLKGSVEDINNILERQDLKNGVDVFLDDDKNIVFKVYGQGYEYKGKNHLVETDIIMKFKSEDKPKVENIFEKSPKTNKKSKEIDL